MQAQTLTHQICLHVHEAAREDVTKITERSGNADSDTLRPVLLFVHGGGWKRGSRYNWLLGFHQNIGYAFASRGVLVVNVDYRKSIGPSALGGPATLLICALVTYAIRRFFPSTAIGRTSFVSVCAYSINHKN